MSRFGKPPTFDGQDYGFWKVRMKSYLQSLGSLTWEICIDPKYVIENVRLTQMSIDRHEANNRAKNAIFGFLARGEFDHVSDLEIAHQI